MSFVNTEFVVYALIAIALIALVLNRLNAGYFKWIRSYWFYERTWASRFSSFLYILSLLLFMLSLLDLRGPERKIKASLPDQRTIILLDTSASMLAEDVRPNRFIKSLQIARHFVKNAPGHQISIVLFSDIQKRLIPFTDDIDLIDSRLAALEKTNAVAGGSNISQALEESIGYFENDGEEKSSAGNILMFTDAEESEGEIRFKVPANVNLAIVGVGTAKGANIPLRYEDGGFKGYKSYKGSPVVTKLDEDYIKKLGKHVPNFKYWIANSYSLPTEEIMNFFRSTYNKKQSSGDMRVRPVYSHYILIPAILLYCLSVIVGRFPAFKVPRQIIYLLILGSLSGINSARAQDESAPREKEQISPEIRNDLERIKEGRASREQVLKTAEKMLRAKDDKRATELYQEYGKNNDSEEVRFNHATALLKSDRFKEALPLVQGLLKNSKNEDLKEKLRNNIALYFDKKQQQQKNQQENKDKNQDKNQQQKNEDKKDNKDNKDNKDQKNQDNKKDQQNKSQNNKDQKDNKGQQNQDQQKNQSGKSGDKDEKKEKKDKKDQKDKGEKDKKEEGDQGEDQNEEQQKRPSTLEEKEKDIEQKRRMVKTPAMIKQILSDDRELQKKMMDTSTNKRGEMKPKRDW